MNGLISGGINGFHIFSRIHLFFCAWLPFRSANSSRMPCSFSFFELYQFFCFISCIPFMLGNPFFQTFMVVINKIIFQIAYFSIYHKMFIYFSFNMSFIFFEQA